MMNSEVPSGKRVRNYGLKKKTCDFSWVNPLFLWPCSIAFCMFTRPGIKYEFIPSKFDMPNPPRDDQRINHPNMLESGKRHSLKGTSPSSRQIGSNRYLQDNICFQKNRPTHHRVRIKPQNHREINPLRIIKTYHLSKVTSMKSSSIKKPQSLDDD